MTGIPGYVQEVAMKRSVVYIVVIALLAFAGGCTQYMRRAREPELSLAVLQVRSLITRIHGAVGLIGAAHGGVFGATITDVSMRASQESAAYNRPAEYRTTDGRAVYRADPLPADDQTRCKKVRERVWENDRLVKDQVREVCER